MVLVTSDDIATVAVTELPADAAPSPFLLDVRELDEWDAGHAPSAVHVPMGEVVARIAEIPRDADVVVVCRSGHRSAAVTAYLSQGGWRARNLDGGMIAWQAAGRPMTSETGSQPTVI
jgi:rhodanese-related sulfurtransferase